jgi:phage terminase large subunit-like protein
MARGPRSVAEQYMAEVLRGRIVVSQLVRLQIERHYRDLKEGKNRGLRFNRKAAQKVIDFFPLFTIGTEDEWKGVPIQLEPWWQALLWILYGWQRRHGKRWVRRFKFGYVEVGRGNLKSLVGAGLCLYEFRGRGVQGARVYCAATDKRTAKLVFDTARTMVLETWQDQPVIVSKDNLADLETGSKFEPCASEDQNLLGLRPSFVLLDELHVHPTSGVWDVFESALGKRIEALQLGITNSGFDRNTVCYKQREYAENVLRGVVPDDTWFGWICGLDPVDIEDPKGFEDESKWGKANPSGAVRVEDLRARMLKAKADPSSLNAFLRFRLCVWTTEHSEWMPMEKWNACCRPIEREKLRGRRCFGALDLSTVTDISAFVLLFEPVDEDPYWRLLPNFFLPKENIAWRCRHDRVPYDVWERQGLFSLTEGNVIDYRAIRAKIHNLRDEFLIAQIGFDRWNSTDIVTNLQEDGFELVRIGQGFAGMAYPTKRFMELVLSGQFAHDGNEVLRWNVRNVIVQQDPAGNMKPDKSKSREKIDGAVASIIAVSLVMAATAPSSNELFFV